MEGGFFFHLLLEKLRVWWDIFLFAPKEILEKNAKKAQRVRACPFM